MPFLVKYNNAEQCKNIADFLNENKKVLNISYLEKVASLNQKHLWHLIRGESKSINPRNIKLLIPVLEKIGFIKLSGDITLKAISKAICLYYNIDFSQLTKRTNRRETTDKRHIAMYFSRMKIKYPYNCYSRIGSYYGGFKHDSVMYAVSEISNLRKTNPEIARQVREIEERYFSN